MNEYQKWAEVCQILKDKGPNFYFKKREVWRSYFGFNIGQEENGKHDDFERPVLILKKISKNLFWGLPLTTKYKGEYYKFYVGKINGEKNYVLVEQLKVLSTRRLMFRIGFVNDKFFNQVRAILKEAI